VVDFHKIKIRSTEERAREEAALWHNQPLIALDVETTGLDPHVDRIIEVGLARFESGVCVHQISRYVHPERDPRLIDFEVLKLNHIDPRDLMHAPPFWRVYNEIAPMFEGAYPLAFNAAFDRAFFLSSVMRSWPPNAFNQIPFMLGSARWIDPCAMSRAVYDLYGHRLADVARVCGLPQRVKHEARQDAVTAGELAVIMGRAHPRRFPDLETIFRVQREEAAISRTERLHSKAKTTLTRGTVTAHECDVCFKVEATWDGKLPQGWGIFHRGNLTTCGPACDTIAGWWAEVVTCR